MECHELARPWNIREDFDGDDLRDDFDSDDDMQYDPGSPEDGALSCRKPGNPSIGQLLQTIVIV
jgi:hypothetical protein